MYNSPMRRTQLFTKTRKKPFLTAWAIGAIPISLFAFFAGQVIGSIPLRLYAQLSGKTDSQTLRNWVESSVTPMFIMGVLAASATLLLLYGFMSVLGLTLRSIGLARAKLKDFWYALSGYVVSLALFVLIAMLLKVLLPNLDLAQKQPLGFDTAVSGLALVPIFIYMVVLIPLVEEILFRGFLYTGLRNKLKPVIATLITSGLFAAAHLEWGSNTPLLWVVAINTFIGSVVLCFLRERTGRLAAPIMLHVIQNGIAFATLFIFKIA